MLDNDPIAISVCGHCNQESLWDGGWYCPWCDHKLPLLMTSAALTQETVNLGREWLDLPDIRSSSDDV